MLPFKKYLVYKKMKQLDQFTKKNPKWCKSDIHLSALTWPYFFLSWSVKIKPQPLKLPVCAASSTVEGFFFNSNLLFKFFFVLFSLKSSLLTSWNSVSILRQKLLPEQLNKRKHPNQNQFGACFLLNQTRTAPAFLMQSANRHFPFGQ